ncbi:MAG: TetR/AcrR family transcriptional regulator [Candidatus Schekmanbacteria bacterium]|nr:TetR/AcrR family transcriptional regulator [Candidatus Schekmanbacteria bacterium]
MARPVHANAAVTRDRLLRSASQLFAERGLDGASLREIARGAEVNLAMVHHYFGNKEQLYAACQAAAYEDLADDIAGFQGLFGELAGAVERAGTRAEIDVLIAPVVGRGFRFVREHRAAVQMLMRGVIERGELDPRWRNQALLPFVGRTARRVAAACGQSEARVRLGIHSLVALIMRYSLSTTRELAAMLGRLDDPASTGQEERGNNTEEAILEAFEEHLVDVARALIGAGPGAGEVGCEQ